MGFMKDGAQWLVDNTDIKLVGELDYCDSVASWCILLRVIFIFAAMAITLILL